MIIIIIIIEVMTERMMTELRKLENPNRSRCQKEGCLSDAQAHIVLALSETWLSQDHSRGAYSILNFRMIRKN